MCECITTVNADLKQHNTMLVFTLPGNPSRAVVDTMPIETGRGKKKAVPVVASYCPFCGERYQAKPEQAAA